MSAATGEPFGRYLLQAPLGEGGMARVWKAWDRELQRAVAVKQLKEAAADAGEVVARLQREARLAARLHHPHIVAVHEVGVVDGRPFIALEYVEGCTFAARLAETRAEKRAGAAGDPGRLRAEIGILAQVAEAVAYAHDAGIVHRDLKPANILLDGAGHAFVSDFGLARDVAAPAGGASGTGTTALTVKGQVLGTPAYMSPEQARGDLARVGPPSDIWALGAILYEVLTGWMPFEGPQVWDLLSAVIADDPLPPRRRCPSIPVDLEAVCLAAMEKDPARRTTTAREFAAELARWLRGEPVRARRAGGARRAWRWAARRKGWLTVVAAATLLLAAVLGLAHEQRARRIARARADLREIAAAVRGFEDALHRTPLPPETRRELAAQPLGALERLIADDPGFGPAYAWRADVEALLGAAAAAQADYDRACALSPQTSGVWFLRGRNRLQEYASGRPFPAVTFSRTGVRVQAETGETPAGQRLRQEGLGDLERADRAPVRDPSLGDEDVRLCRALTRFCGGDADAPGATVALLEGLAGPRAGRLRGCALYLAGRPDEAERALRAALAEWPEDLLARVWLGEARLAQGATREAAGADPRDAYQAAAAAFEVALRAAADPRACQGRGIAYHRLGQAEETRGADPRASYAAAIADFDRFLALNPGLADAYASRGTVRWRLARCQKAQGQDARATLRLALADLSAAVERKPDAFSACDYRAEVLLALGQADAADGGDPRPDIRRAIEDCDRVLAQDPTYVDSHGTRARACAALGAADAAHGEDARASLGRAIADYDWLLQRDPKDGALHLSRAFAHKDLGEAEARAGVETRASFRRSEDDCLRALQCGDARGRLALGQLYGAWGRTEESIAAFEAAIPANPALAAWANDQLAAGRRLLAAEGWEMALARGRRLAAAGDLGPARAPYERGLALLAADLQRSPGAAGGADGRRAALADAHVRLAGVLARLSAGAGVAAPLREAAVLHLQAAARAGLRDAAALRSDPDLAPLRDDPRFRVLTGE